MSGAVGGVTAAELGFTVISGSCCGLLLLVIAQSSCWFFGHQCRD
ncbi:Uncharacterised protein [Vibrio cholerae]|nr:Uncharacterised protein [Vibrio cholerae]